MTEGDLEPIRTELEREANSLRRVDVEVPGLFLGLWLGSGHEDPPDMAVAEVRFPGGRLYAETTLKPLLDDATEHDLEVFDDDRGLEADEGVIGHAGSLHHPVDFGAPFGVIGVMSTESTESIEDRLAHKPSPGEPCKVCGRTFTREEYHDYTVERCSLFCQDVTQEERKAFLKLEPGQFGVYPCADCGCAMEDDYQPTACCSDCSKKRRAKGRLAILEKCLPYVPTDLQEEIRACLKLGSRDT